MAWSLCAVECQTPPCRPTTPTLPTTAHSLRDLCRRLECSTTAIVIAQASAPLAQSFTQASCPSPASAYVTPWKDDVVTLIGHREGDKVARYTSPVLKRDSASPVKLDFGTTFYNIDRLTLVGVEDFSNFVRTSTTCMREGSFQT